VVALGRAGPFLPLFVTPDYLTPAIAHGRLKADAGAHAAAVMPAIREAQAAGAKSLRQNRRRIEWAQHRDGARR
jgi:hypothetical protein